jgi:hypothetical protein
MLLALGFIPLLETLIPIMDLITNLAQVIVNVLGPAFTTLASLVKGAFEIIRDSFNEVKGWIKGLGGDIDAATGARVVSGPKKEPWYVMSPFDRNPAFQQPGEMSSEDFYLTGVIGGGGMGTGTPVATEKAVETEDERKRLIQIARENELDQLIQKNRLKTTKETNALVLTSIKERHQAELKSAESNLKTQAEFFKMGTSNLRDISSLEFKNEEALAKLKERYAGEESDRMMKNAFEELAIERTISGQKRHLELRRKEAEIDKLPEGDEKTRQMKDLNETAEFEAKKEQLTYQGQEKLIALKKKFADESAAITAKTTQEEIENRKRLALWNVGVDVLGKGQERKFSALDIMAQRESLEIDTEIADVQRQINGLLIDEASGQEKIIALEKDRYASSERQLQIAQSQFEKLNAQVREGLNLEAPGMDAFKKIYDEAWEKVRKLNEELTKQKTKIDDSVTSFDNLRRTYALGMGPAAGQDWMGYKLEELKKQEEARQKKGLDTTNWRIEQERNIQLEWYRWQLENADDLNTAFVAKAKVMLDEVRNAYTMWANTVADNMSSSFSDFFFDVMEGKVKSLQEYLTGFFTNINRAIADFLSKKFTGMVIEFLFPELSKQEMIQNVSLSTVADMQVGTLVVGSIQGLEGLLGGGKQFSVDEGLRVAEQQVATQQQGAEIINIASWEDMKKADPKLSGEYDWYKESDRSQGTWKAQRNEYSRQQYFFSDDYKAQREAEEEHLQRHLEQRENIKKFLTPDLSPEDIAPPEYQDMIMPIASWEDMKKADPKLDKGGYDWYRETDRSQGTWKAQRNDYQREQYKLSDDYQEQMSFQERKMKARQERIDNLRESFTPDLSPEDIAPPEYQDMIMPIASWEEVEVASEEYATSIAEGAETIDDSATSLATGFNQLQSGASSLIGVFGDAGSALLNIISDLASSAMNSAGSVVESSGFSGAVSGLFGGIADWFGGLDIFHDGGVVGASSDTKKLAGGLQHDEVVAVLQKGEVVIPKGGVSDFIDKYSRAAGGPVEAGTGYLTGEQGRELFAPSYGAPRISASLAKAAEEAWAAKRVAAMEAKDLAQYKGEYDRYRKYELEKEAWEKEQKAKAEAAKAAQEEGGGLTSYLPSLLTSLGLKYGGNLMAGLTWLGDLLGITAVASPTVGGVSAGAGVTMGSFMELEAASMLAEAPVASYSLTATEAAIEAGIAAGADVGAGVGASSASAAAIQSSIDAGIAAGGNVGMGTGATALGAEATGLATLSQLGAALPGIGATMVGTAVVAMVAVEGIKALDRLIWGPSRTLQDTPTAEIVSGWNQGPQGWGAGGAAPVWNELQRRGATEGLTPPTAEQIAASYTNWADQGSWGWAAKGGKFDAGKHLIVGEEGPELFIPQTSGTIIPNGATEKIMQMFDGGGMFSADSAGGFVGMLMSQLPQQSPTAMGQLFESGDLQNYFGGMAQGPEIAMRAAGGYVSGGSPYIVGEGGVEAFVSNLPRFHSGGVVGGGRAPAKGVPNQVVNVTNRVEGRQQAAPVAQNNTVSVSVQSLDGADAYRVLSNNRDALASIFSEMRLDNNSRLRR